MSTKKVAQTRAEEKPKPAAPPAPSETRPITAAEEIDRQISEIILLGERVKATVGILQAIRLQFMEFQGEDDEDWCLAILQEDAERSVKELVVVAKAHRHGLQEFCKRQPTAKAA